MAESSVSFLVQKLYDLVSQEASLFGAVKGEVRQLCKELEWIRLFLEYADGQRRYDERFKLWVNQVRDAAFDAEDVIDEYVFKVERKRQQRLNNLKFLNFLPACLNFVDKLQLAHELMGRITDINTTFEKILVYKKRYGIEYPRASEAGSSSEPWRYSNQMVARKEKRLPTVEETNVVGMKNDVEAVKGKLLEGATERVVVAIWGMGGLGKTTLAKKVYNDSDVQQHFKCRAWVFVSQEYNIRELLLGIANCVTTLTDEQKGKNENELGEEVKKCLQGKRYLIVLDDIWNTNVWRGLRSYFPAESNKSRVVITTRNQGIALDAHSDCHELQPLGDKESWDLFLNKVRSAGLEEFKKEILEKCKGLPLAIVVLGGLLSLKDLTQHSWRKVLDSKDWHLSQGPDSCLGVLALSYNNLPSYLKPCFLYCGVFPEDSEIKASELIQLWVAEGFVQKRGKETPEDIAEDYLYELIQRSIIQVADTRADGRVKSCRIHDLLRDLAISEAKEEKLFEVDENIDVDVLPTSNRRLIGNINQTNSPHLQNSNLRSLILNGSPIDEGGGVFLHKYPKLLRVLHVDLVQDRGIYDVDLKLSGKIGELIHLKYLCLGGIKTEIRLPPSIGGLVNLQTLDSGDNYIRIPHTIWKLKQMRHLNCWRGTISSRQSMRETWVEGHLGVHQMTNLQTLYLEAGDWLKDNNLGKLAHHHLKQLKLNLEYHSELKEGSFRSIAQLTGLQKLKLLSDNFIESEGLSTSNAEVESTPILFPGLESFSHHKCLYKLHLVGPIRKLPVETTLYPPNLMQLKLFRTRMEEDPMPILGRLPNLRILTLLPNSYVGTGMNCPHGGFLRLEFLQMQGLVSLEDLSVAEGAMPNLKTLKIEFCREVRKFPDGLLQLKKLQRLNLYFLPNELISEVLETQGEDWNRIRRIITFQVPPHSW
ncbi:disease resistance protein RPP13-like [Vitis riparia]|uniref:disease resistance protein RPP13-like n=1 Tax=Vitis riparia TaxID=96939 RepID=UPI00155A2C1F|nr:disease resistance protein RPP13-like [Vitis riparia]XP_034708558.1 disease resistance protein RPP13-like [Vitis riparia]XP_034708559.1 disease resistance protein RPP13-like [Vitis riparia]